MLEFFRTHKDSIVLKVFLGLLALSFGIWGVGDFMGTTSLSPGVALKAGDAEVKTQLVQRRFTRELERFREAMGGKYVPDDVMRRSVMASMMQDLTRAAVLDAAALKVGISATRDQVREVIVTNKAFQQDGKFSQMLFDEALSRSEINEASYVELSQTDLRTAILMQPVALNATAPKSLVDALFNYRSETRISDTLLIPSAAMALQRVPADADLKTVYDKNIAAFTAPEYRKLTVLMLESTALVKPESVDDAEVKTYYDENAARFQAPETRHIVQLVFETKEKAAAARAQLGPGETLEALAAKTGAGSVIDLGELAANSPLVKTIGAAFTTPAQEISQPTESPLGWHLFETKSVKPEAIKTLEMVKDEIRKTIAADKGADAVYDASTHMEDALASGTPPADVAKMVGARVVTIESIDEGGRNKGGLPLPNLFDPKHFLATAFATPAGKDSKLMDMPTRDGYYVIHVDEVTPPAPKPLLDVRADVAALWEADERTRQAQAMADKLAADIGPPTLMSALESKDKRMSYAPLGPVTRFGEGLERQHVIDATLISPQVLDKLFAAKIGDVITAPVATGILVARLKDIAAPQAVGELAGARDQLATSIHNDIGANLADQLSHAFAIQFPVEIDQKAIDAMVTVR